MAKRPKPETHAASSQTAGDISKALLADIGLRPTNTDYRDRFRENLEKMKAGSLLALAEVIQGLLILQAKGPLSFRDKKMLDRACHMLIHEAELTLIKERVSQTVPVPDALREHCVTPTLIRALEVFGDRIKAEDWLASAHPALAGRTPLEVLDEGGFQTVDDLLTRVEHGIPS